MAKINFVMKTEKGELINMCVFVSVRMFVCLRVHPAMTSLTSVCSNSLPESMEKSLKSRHRQTLRKSPGFPTISRSFPVYVRSHTSLHSDQKMTENNHLFKKHIIFPIKLPPSLSLSLRPSSLSILFFFFSLSLSDTMSISTHINHSRCSVSRAYILSVSSTLHSLSLSLSKNRDTPPPPFFPAPP